MNSWYDTLRISYTPRPSLTASRDLEIEHLLDLNCMEQVFQVVLFLEGPQYPGYAIPSGQHIHAGVKERNQSHWKPQSNRCFCFFRLARIRSCDPVFCRGKYQHWLLFFSVKCVSYHSSILLSKVELTYREVLAYIRCPKSTKYLFM